jgi:exosortase
MEKPARVASLLLAKSLHRRLSPNMTTRTRILTFFFLCAVSILFWWHFLVVTWKLALANDAYTHILLILPLSAALIYADSKWARAKLVRTERGPVPIVGMALLAVALLIGTCVRWRMNAASDDVRRSIAMLALATWWVSGIVACFGGKTFRALLFPLCFLFLIVPIPDFALRWIVEFLQQQSAIAAQLMFRAIGVPAMRDGIIVSIPGLNLEVARECSSIRSSLMLVVSTLVLAHLFLTSVWRKTALVLAAIPLSVLKNGLRIFTIGELGTRVDPEFLSGKLHHSGGIIFFAVSVMLVGALLFALHRTEARPERDSVA